jgi:hypothetical protein
VRGVRRLGGARPYVGADRREVDLLAGGAVVPGVTVSGLVVGDTEHRFREDGFVDKGRQPSLESGICELDVRFMAIVEQVRSVKGETRNGVPRPPIRWAGSAPYH